MLEVWPAVVNDVAWLIVSSCFPAHRLLDQHSQGTSVFEATLLRELFADKPVYLPALRGIGHDGDRLVGVGGVVLRNRVMSVSNSSNWSNGFVAWLNHMSIKHSPLCIGFLS